MTLSRTTPLRRGQPPKRKARMKRGAPIRRQRRSAAEMERVYGSKARRAWLKAKPCVVCVMVVPILALSAKEWHSDLAHTVTGGMSRKADASTVVPMCRRHHRMYDTHEGFLGKPEVRAAIIGAAAAYDLAWTSQASARSPEGKTQ